jgi:hypothetical protein
MDKIPERTHVPDPKIVIAADGKDRNKDAGESAIHAVSSSEHARIVRMLARFTPSAT